MVGSNLLVVFTDTNLLIITYFGLRAAGLTAINLNYSIGYCSESTLIQMIPYC